MMKLLKKAFYSTLVFIILIICILSFFITTTPGLYTAIRVAKLFIPGTLTIHQLNGRILDNFSIGELDYQRDDINIKIKNLTVNWHFKDLLHHQIGVDNLSTESIELKQNNSIHTLNKVKLVGLLNRDIGTLEIAQLNYLDQRINSQLKFDRKFPWAISGKININSKDKIPSALSGRIDIGGSLDQIQWTGDLHGPLNLSLNGTLKNQSELNQIIKWRNFRWNNETQTINSPEGRIQINGTFPALTIDISTKLNAIPEDYWKMNARIVGSFPWQWNFDANLAHPKSSSAKSEGLDINLSAKGTLKDHNHGNLALTLHPGGYGLQDNTALPNLQFMGGTINFILSPQNLSGTGVIAIDKNKQLNLNFKLPQFKLSEGLMAKQPLSGNLSLNLNSLDFIDNMTPEINNAKGQIKATINARGTLGKAVFDSKLNLTKASLKLPSLGLDLNAIDLKIIGTQQRWEAAGSISSANKKMLIQGKGNFTSIMDSKFNIKGSDFPIVNTQEYQINISPQLTVTINPSSINVSGTILVPYAQIKPQTFTNSLSLSEDVVFKSQKEALPPQNYATAIDVTVKMGDQVELTFKGLHALLEGTVNIKQRPLGLVNANGELTVKKGEYKAYGQDLSIEQGQLIFTGGQLENPGINLKASKTINNTSVTASGSNQLFDFNTNNLQNVNLGSTIKVGVEVTGKITAPKILLFSNPSILSQADTLSMLLLGRPASQATKAGGQLLLAAISSMNLGTGTNGAQLLEQLKQNLGFDVNVQTNSNYNQQTKQVTDTTALVVGKSLSKRLYLSYNVGLSQTDPNVLTLKYLLNKFFSIQVSNSRSGNGIDLLYSRSKDKINE